MKAIITKYLPPTNTKPSRIKAMADGGHQLTISYGHELSAEQLHKKAAHALCAKLGWDDSKDLVGGVLPNDTGYAWCFKTSTVGVSLP